MNGIQISVKTNTVLVCKDLAEAQFRCMECCKAFISERHLGKHNLKRHGLTQYFIAEQTDPANDNERKFAEVTERLEKALSILEAKTNSLDSTASHDRPDEDTVREKLAINAQFDDKVLKPSRPFSDVRRTVSLFTLPNDRACEPIIDGWMNQSSLDGEPKTDVDGDIRDPSGPGGESQTEKLMSNEDTRKISIHDGPSVERNHAFNNSNPELESSPRGIPMETQECGLGNDRPAGSIEPLLITLINKLDNVFTGNRVVANSECQTCEVEVYEPKSPLTEHMESNMPVPGQKKSVRFSDSPMYYGSLEQRFNQSESECSSPSSVSKFEDEGAGFVGNELSQTYTNYNAQSQVTRPVCHQAESAGETQIEDTPDPEMDSCPGQNEVDASGDSCHCPDAYEMSDAKKGVFTSQNDEETVQESEHSCSEDEPENDCSRSCETAIPVAATANPAAEIQPSNYPQPTTIVVASPKVRQSVEYVATKKQILDIVEKCVKDLKEKRNQSTSSIPSSPCNPSQCQNREFTTSDEKNSGFSDAKQKSPELHKNSNCKTSSKLICLGNGNISVDSLGILPPSTLICKDEEMDIDELSGDSYERFMKRFHSRASESVRDDEQTVTNRPLPNANQLCADSQHQARHRENHLVAPVCQNPARQDRLASADEMKGRTTNAKYLQNVTSDMKKTDYAVLLHHETSQVQSLIDTLVSDLQRWRNARRDNLSHAIRIQLEERLASNLNLLGIQSHAKLLSDSAADTAHLKLKTQRSKSAKQVPTSYFDVLKYAFVNEVDRIAKSRVIDDHDPTM